LIAGDREGASTCAGAGGASAAEAFLLDDEADAYEGGGGDREERAREVGSEEVAAVVRRGGSHRRRAAAAARGRRIWGEPGADLEMEAGIGFLDFSCLKFVLVHLENVWVAVRGIGGRRERPRREWGEGTSVNRRWRFEGYEKMERFSMV
jgi:hypothetical protein